MIDISDGLLADLGHVAAASAVVIDVRRPDVPQKLVEVGAALGIDPVSFLLTGGEDHALAATFPPGAELPAAFTAIGEVRAGDAAVLVEGKPYDGDAGWTHFA
jgi:thiamine-monophosphate kinase